MVAPSATAASVACAIRAGNPSNAVVGGASGAGTAGSGPSGEPYTFAQPVVDTVSTAAVAIRGHARQVISRSCVPFAHVAGGLRVAAIRRDFAAWAQSGTIDQLSPAVVGRTARFRLPRDAPRCPKPIG